MLCSINSLQTHHHLLRVFSFSILLFLARIPLTSCLRQMPPGPPPPCHKEALQLNEQQLNDPRCIVRSRPTRGLGDRCPTQRLICARVEQSFATSRLVKETQTLWKEKASRWPLGYLQWHSCQIGTAGDKHSLLPRQIRRNTSNDDVNNFALGKVKRLLELSSSVFTTLAFYFRLATFPRCCSSRSGGAYSVSSCGCLEAAAL